MLPLWSCRAVGGCYWNPGAKTVCFPEPHRHYWWAVYVGRPALSPERHILDDINEKWVFGLQDLLVWAKLKSTDCAVRVPGLSPQMTLNNHSPSHIAKKNESPGWPYFSSSGFSVILKTYIVSDIRLLYCGHRWWIILWLKSDKVLINIPVGSFTDLKVA